jgi:large subunit ribosomal protein L23
MATTTNKPRKTTEAKLIPGERMIVRQPRLSEKAVALSNKNQFVFTVDPKATKLQIQRQLEAVYGIKIARINTIQMQGKARKYGKSSGRTRKFKKAIVSLTADSKKPEILEAA